LNSRFWTSTKIFVVVTLTLIISQYIVFNMLLFPIHEAKAVKDKTPPSSSLPGLSSKKGNTISPSSPTTQSSNGSPSICIIYDPSTRTITVSCSSSRLSDIDNKLHDSSILTKQSPADGVWFLNANLVIAKGAIFHIDSTDTKWLTISSKVTHSAGATKLAPAYWIDVHGTLKIDSVKVTSWDPTTNYYARTNGSRTGTDVFILGAPRPSIVVENNATGTTDITNSEIAYLGNNWHDELR
jgi:mannuronan 5-epimerase